MKIKDLLFNREKLRKYDELKEWRGAFSNDSAKLSLKLEEGANAMDNIAWIKGVRIPDNIKGIIHSALDAEIKKLDEE